MDAKLIRKRGKVEMKVIDCDQRGLICEDGSIPPWNEIDAIGKIEHLGREMTWATYYLRRRGESKNIRLPALGRFPLFGDERKEEREMA